jgi:hypothetical protein
VKFAPALLSLPFSWGVAAKRLNITPADVRVLVLEGRLHAAETPRGLRFSPSAIHAFQVRSKLRLIHGGQSMPNRERALAENCPAAALKEGAP